MHDMTGAPGDLMNRMNSVWPDGMLRCEINSPARRLVWSDDGVFTQTMLPEHLPDIQVQAIVDPRMVARAVVDVRAETERRLLFQLIEFGIRERVWPVAPVVRWRKWDAQACSWSPTLVSPQEP